MIRPIASATKRIPIPSAKLIPAAFDAFPTENGLMVGNIVPIDDPI